MTNCLKVGADQTIVQVLSLRHLDCGVAPALKERVICGELNSRAREGIARQGYPATSLKFTCQW